MILAVDMFQAGCRVGSRLGRRSDTLGKRGRVGSEGECCTYQGLSDRYPRNESSSVHGKNVNGKSMMRCYCC